MEKQSIIALMSCFGRTYHAENERHPVFRDTLAKQLLTQADKKRRIERAGWPAAENLTFVPADLAADDLAQRLDTAGFARGERAFFSWLGVTYYLTEEAIGRTLDALEFFACGAGGASGGARLPHSRAAHARGHSEKHHRRGGRGADGL